MTRDQSHREIAFIKHTRSLHHHVHGRQRHDGRHLHLHTRLVQWFTALKLTIDSWLIALSYTRGGLRPYTLRDYYEGENLRALEGRQCVTTLSQGWCC